MIIEGYFFLFLIETICCDPSSEPSRRIEGSQRMFLTELTKNIHNYHQILPLIYSTVSRSA